MGLLSALGLTIIPLLAKPRSPDVLLSQATERIAKLEADNEELRKRVERLERMVLYTQQQATQQAQQNAYYAQMQTLAAQNIHQLGTQQGVFTSASNCNCVPTRASVIG